VPIDRSAALREAEDLERQGHLDRAIAAYERIADALKSEGMMPAAAQLYEKVLQLSAASSEPAEGAPVEALDLEDVFGQLRVEAGRRSLADAAAYGYARADALEVSSDVDGSRQMLEAASQVPTLRFATAVTIGRIHSQRNELMQAIEWFEKAAQAPAPSPDDYQQLLFELADALEASGETARALAVCIELLADAGDFRDVKARVSRLNKVQARG
jgi:tetratricopeptide (TPR) repeat protein